MFLRSALLCPSRLVPLLLVGLAAPPLPASDPQFQPYRIEAIFPQLTPILEAALQQSPQMLARSLDITQAEAAYVMTRSNLIPRLDGSLYYSTNETSITEQASVRSRSDGLFYNIAFYQPVFQWGTLKAQVDSSKIGIEVAKKNYAEAYRLLAVTIRQQYLTLIVRKASVRLAREGLRLQQANLEVEEERLRAGRISAGDIIAPRLAVDEALLNVERAESELLQVRRFFGRLTGLPLLEDAAIPDTLPVDPLLYSADRAAAALEFFEATGIDELLPVQVLNDQIRQADLNYKVNRFRLYPKFSIVANISQSNSTNASPGFVSQVGVNSRNLNLQATWAIFDGFATSGAKLSALTTKRASERQLATVRQVSLDQARDLERQLRFSARAVQLHDTRRALSEDAMKRMRDNVQRGLGTQKDADATALQYQGSDFSALVQRVDLLNRWAEFLSLTGRDPALLLLPGRFLNHGK